MESELLNALVGALIIVIPALAAFVGRWLNAKTFQITQTTKNEDVNFYINLASDTAKTVVDSLSQTLVIDLKNKAADGKLSDAEKQEILSNATERVISTLGESGILAIETAFDDAQQWIVDKIEQAIWKSRKI